MRSIRARLRFAERIVLRAKKTFFPPRIRLKRMDPIVHHPPTDERRHLLRSVPAVQEQSVAAVWASSTENWVSCMRALPLVGDDPPRAQVLACSFCSRI